MASKKRNCWFPGCYRSAVGTAKAHVYDGYGRVSRVVKVQACRRCCRRLGVCTPADR